MDPLSYLKKSPFESFSKSSCMLATTVLVLILIPLCTGHLGSLPFNGEGMPPLLNHIRVSRGPGTVDEYGDFTKSKGTSTGRMSLIKSPSYQHRMLHMPHFHNSNPSDTGASHHQHNSLNDHNLGLQNPLYPVTRVSMRNGMIGNLGRRSSGFNTNGELVTDDNLQEGVDNLSPLNIDEGEEEQEPTFTPFIGARALSNIPKFFEHIRENLDALHLSQQLEDEEDDTAPRNYIEVQKDLPERRGDYFMSDGRLSINMDDLGYEYENDKEKENGRQGSGDQPRMRTNDLKSQDPSRELDILMGKDPKYKKANQYNPAWLFTNLGLGKRSHL